MERLIFGTNTSIEQCIDWSDVDELMETDEMEFKNEMDCFCRTLENLRISPQCEKFKEDKKSKRKKK